MTLSIAAWDEASGQLGAAIASSSISVGSRCLHWQPGTGIALSQNITDPRLGPRMLSLLADGVDVSSAVAAVVQSTPHIRFRQLGLVDNKGNTALYTGAAVLGCFASAEGRHCVAAGNLLANDSVPTAMVQAFEKSDGSFGSRVLGALRAGVAAGGEAGALHSAGMLIGGEPSWPLAELRIDWDDDPIARMMAGWVVYEPQIDDYVTRAYNPEDAPSYGVPGDP
ncbi:MAG: DUF1028 domain-containing protein [Gammaproteobacteria bacterium]|nr:DUF1028 domain-containing protein [Gammaproteobacteria bacterium]MDH3450546.1 DUF1028 domain-containing protein [Gammaproteobacteria bacterium]